MADVNHFQAAGGLGFLIRELLDAGLMHEDVGTIWGESNGKPGMRGYTVEAKLDEKGDVEWHDATADSGNEKVLAPVAKAFRPDGGLKVLNGNLGKAVIKTSAVKEDRQIVEAPAKVFHTQEALQVAFKAGELNEDFIAVIRFQGPQANGMPELHKLTPSLGVLQDCGFNVALVTDGRMSGASGKVPAAIHVTPEAKCGGAIAKVREGDMVRLDAKKGTLEILVDTAEFNARPNAAEDLSDNDFGMGRELFAGFRNLAGTADTGASVF